MTSTHVIEVVATAAKVAATTIALVLAAATLVILQIVAFPARTVRR